MFHLRFSDEVARVDAHHVVSLDHVCGAHSETDEDVAPTTVPKNQAALSDADLEVTAS